MNKIKYPSVKDVIRRWELYFGYDHPKVDPIPLTRDQDGNAVVSVNKKYYQRYIKNG
jgi:hypothetical protein|tara:strand:- start:12177 stop:12347 length:171 start_codon:yes stop_codon:yes gene_type:complete